MTYQVDLWKKETYLVDAQDEEEAIDIAVRHDSSKQNNFTHRYYDMIECEELNEEQVQNIGGPIYF